MQRYTPGSGESVVLSMPGSERTGLSLEHLRVVEAVSPTVDAVRTEGGVEITVKDLRGTQTVPLLDGTTPTISASEIPGGHRLTITGAEGTQTLDILDGADGRGISGATLNSDYTLTITYTDGTAYTTPSLRGPKGDPGHTPQKGVDYFDGEPGISPSITITNITGGHRVTITDADGTRAFDVLDGTDGDDGRGIASAALNSDYTLTITYTDGTAYTTPSLRGEPGENGFSPVASVSKAGRVVTITITDKNGTTVATVSDGEDGTPGTSPTVTVTDITGGHRITITDADGAHSFDVMDGDAADAPVQSVNGQTGAVVLDAQDVGAYEKPVTGIPKTDLASDVQTSLGKADTALQNAPVTSVNAKTGSVVLTPSDIGAGTYSKPAGGIPASDLAAGVIPTVPVQDVQVNGTSVVTNGVANVPVASSSVAGVVRYASNYGIWHKDSPEDDVIRIAGASVANVKAGVSSYLPICPASEHAAAFYGLAKAAGDTTQSQSSNTVGNYTDAAKSAISQMLNGSVSVTGTTPTITALPGVRYVCGEVETLSFTPSATGICDVVFTSGSTPTVLTVPNTVKWPAWFNPTSLDANTTYELNVMDGVYGVVGVWN